MSIGYRLVWLPFWLWVAVLLPVSLLHAQPLARIVLALYDGDSASDIRATAVHRLAEMPLNHLGLVVRYHDINSPLPSLKEMGDVRGVLVWEAAGMEDPREFIRWSEMLMDSGRQMVMISGFGSGEEISGGRYKEEINGFWKRLGLHSESDWVPFTYRTEIVYRDPRLVDFERRVGGVLPGYERMRVIKGRGYSGLSVRQRGDRPSGTSDLVVVTDSGGWIASDYAYYHNEATDTLLWYVNPFEFFSRALKLDDLPRPDTTTLAGRRIFFSHIDGDGWNNFTEIHPYRHRGILSAEVVKRKIIEAYPDLPVTVAPIAGDLDSAWHGSEKSMQVAREIFALPQVEAGVHTYSHPFDWGFFADGDQDRERPFLGLYAKPWGEPESLLKVESGGHDYYRETGFEVPRAYAVKPFDLELETRGAIEFVNSLLPPGKRVQIYQWSGDTNPFPEAIAAVRSSGVRNINGGDSRLDRKYPSYGWVSPLGRMVEGELQVYASNSNENIYTDQWSEQFFGYRHLIRTLKNTETPLRIKPMGIYYHMYSGEKLSSLNAVLANLEFARSQPIIPVTTSHYAAIVEGFYSTRIERAGELRWRIGNRQALQTVRFDRALFLAVDMVRSRGVVGQHHYQGSLYVALDSAVPEAVVVLRRREESAVEPSASLSYLVESAWQVWGVRHGSGRMWFETAGFGEGEMLWKVPRAGSYVINMHGGSGATESLTVVVPDDGRLRFAIRARTPMERVRVEVEYRQERI